jgi:predicted RNA binding protein YcfA (HicA-like mRNA interferase family)
MIARVERDELWQRLARRPNSVRFAELERLLLLSGWNLDRVRGSHYRYRRGSESYTVPFRRGHLPPVYVRDVLRLTHEGAGDE